MKKRLTPEEFVKLARELPGDERVPYAFEKRVTATRTSNTQDWRDITGSGGESGGLLVP
jgi:hypothetical protein